MFRLVLLVKDYVILSVVWMFAAYPEPLCSLKILKYILSLLSLLTRLAKRVMLKFGRDMYVTTFR